MLGFHHQKKTLAVSAAMTGLLLLAACGGDSGNSGNGGGGGDGDLYPANRDCSTVAQEPQTLVGTDFSHTPMTRPTPEVLAMEATGDFTADRGRYERITAELTGMRSQFPDETTFVRPCNEPDKLTISFDSETYVQAGENNYSDWSDLNNTLNLEAKEFDDETESVTLTFDGRYNIPRLEQEYGSLSGVVSADGIEPVDGDDVCLAIRDDMHFYIFRTAYNSCDTGCESEVFSAFEADPSGNYSRVGLFNNDEETPEWFTNAEDCRAFLKGQDVSAE